MSIWSDESGSDAFDPNESFGEGSEYEPEESGIEQPQPTASTWTPADGYNDSTGCVRIWVDDNRRLTKILISNRWRERSRGTSLSSMLDEVFLMAQARIAVGAQFAHEPEPERVPPLSWEALAELQQQSFEIAEESARLDALPPDQVQENRWEGTKVEGVSSNRMVRARLNIFGLTEQVTFDSAWLNQSRVSQVCESVMEAHRDAYARYREPVFQPGDREQLAARSDRVQASLMAMMKHGW